MVIFRAKDPWFSPSSVIRKITKQTSHTGRRNSNGHLSRVSVTQIQQQLREQQRVWSGRLCIVLFVGELETKGFRKVLSYFVFTSQFLIAFHLPDASCLGIDKAAHPEGPLILSAMPPGLYNLQNKRHKWQFPTDPCFWWRLSLAVLSFSSWSWISATATACPINCFSLIS